MVNMQTMLAVLIAAAIPTAAALVGILLNNRSTSDLRNEMQAEFRATRVEMTAIHREIAELKAN